MKKENRRVNIAHLRIRVLFFYILIMFIIVNVLTSIIVSSAGSIMSQEVSSLIAANSRQIELNINNYLQNIESTATLMFSDEAYYKYTPDAEGLDEYRRIKAEEKIAERIVDLGLMQNFTDFSIVYDTGNRVGWTSNRTAGLFDSKTLYRELGKCITNARTLDGWTYGLGGTTDRIYYVKRLNPKAILMASFYSRELSSVFEYPEELTGMTISLVNEDDTVLYSSDPDTISGKLNPTVAAILAGSESNEYIANANVCENGWRVVCQIPTSVILSEVNMLRFNSFIIASILFALSMLIGILIINVFMHPVDKAVADLQDEAELDALSGLYNKNSFRSSVVKFLTDNGENESQIFIMIDMDNFKSINDSLGHIYGDKVITRMGGLLNSNFRGEYTIGRLGGDEFAMYASSGDLNREKAIARINSDMDKLFTAFDSEFAIERNQLNVSLSVGIAVINKERRFDNLYSAADDALYESKRGGKNRFTISGTEEVADI